MLLGKFSLGKLLLGKKSLGNYPRTTLGMLGKQDRRISREESRTSREDEDENQDSETPDVLPILRGSAKKKEQSLTNGIVIR